MQWAHELMAWAALLSLSVPTSWRSSARAADSGRTRVGDHEDEIEGRDDVMRSTCCQRPDPRRSVERFLIRRHSTSAASAA